jgi:acyl carrier protein
MMSAQIKADIRKFIVGTWLSGDDRGLLDDTNLQDSGLLDSLTTLSLISFLEESFAIQLDPSDVNADTFSTVDAIASLVTQKTSDARERLHTTK